MIDVTQEILREHPNELEFVQDAKEYFLQCAQVLEEPTPVRLPDPVNEGKVAVVPTQPPQPPSALPTAAVVSFGDTPPGSDVEADDVL